ncbi:unnamed protein product [Toxocara canis]|uniref:NOT2_3_5 domain-containing protein n=1 Tax=Toxocara canis TaxID=6265 RepID=A0A183U125_TOXCA|nr:unnamed protein product [Toxocara canis]
MFDQGVRRGTMARSQSRSTEGSGSGGLTPSNSSQQASGALPVQQQLQQQHQQTTQQQQGQAMAPVGQLGVALQQATGIEAPPSSFRLIIPVNVSHLFSSFPTNPNLLQYQMRPDLVSLPGFRAPNGTMMNTVSFSFVLHAHVLVSVCEYVLATLSTKKSK